MSDPRLARYRAKRDFGITSEPSGEAEVRPGWSFVVQKHDATRLHYDFRLELDGVLLSWAVPKGPSLSPRDRRLAVRTEDHPLDYRDFEGTIPEGQYGGGPVIVWDRGSWTPKGDPRAGLAKGKLEFELAGQKLHGGFVLVRTKDEKTWLLMKRKDGHAREGKEAAIVERKPKSVLSGRTVKGVARARPTARLPAFGSIRPQLATLVDEVPVGEGWIYELKYDGYRALATLEDGRVKIASRSGKDWTKVFREVADALSGVRARAALFDGEICYVMPDGRTDFQHLQNTLGGGGDRGRLVYYVFDLLHHDGEDLSGKPLAARKERLRTLLAGEGPPLRMGDHVSGDGQGFFEEVCRRRLEGVVAKRTDRPYESGRGKSWVKVKCQARQELVIVGYTQPRGTRNAFGALLVGVRDDAGLRYAGKVGTGFSEASLRELHGLLRARVVAKPPVRDPPRMANVTWVRPDLVCEVRFTEWTSDGRLRHPAFQGLRQDKRAREVVREGKVVVEGVTLTHPDRLLAEGVSKQALAEYHAAIAPHLLPWTSHRPLMLLRSTAPGQRFVQKHANRGLAGASHVHVGKVEGEEVLTVDSAAGVVELVQLGVVELHGWGSRMPRWDRPDWIVMDLDPDEGLAFSKVIDAARELHDALAGIGLESWVKTTGGKGLHVVIPLAPRHDWGVVRAVSEGLARALEAQAPGRYVANMAKRARKGKIFVDYLRNAQGATAILPYSPRARPEMPVAMPVSWDELDGLDPADFTVASVPARLARRRRDPWADMRDAKQVLSKAMIAALS